MNTWKALLLFLGPFLFTFSCTNSHLSNGLQVGFYKRSCPNVEAIVRSTVAGFVAQDITIAARLLRLHFHDCFVRGCDGSVLLNSTSTTSAEKDGEQNISLKGFDVIDAVKAKLETACPGVVSCADIIALVARDGVSLTKGAHWEVETGRRDGRVSLASEASKDIPLPFTDIITLKSQFASRGLTPKDLTLLSGAHTIGTSHCESFEKRIYNFTQTLDSDPKLDPTYVPTLRGLCKPGDNTTIVEMVPKGSTTFDTDYFKLVKARRGLFSSDAALLDDSQTRAFVLEYMGDREKFFKDFGVSMVKMGRHVIITGNQGEIRKNCAVVN